MTDLHGGNIYKYRNFLDFSANINPLGMPVSVRKAVIESADFWEKYPDPYCIELTEKISEKEKISAEQIVCGNGANDIICRIISYFQPKNALVCAPSFLEYTRILSGNGCKIRTYFLDEKNDFSVMPDIVKYINQNIDMIFLCSPNNPTGNTINQDILRNIAKKCLSTGTILVCDECFMDFVEDSKNRTSMNFLNKNMIIINAFTKIYAMAGLRLGYGIFGDKKFAEKIRYTGQYWSVSVPAQAAGIAALGEADYLNKTLDYIRKERNFLTNGLFELGFKVFPAEANFIFFRSNLPVGEMLKKEKILIRECKNYNGLDKNFFRIAVRTHNENIALISALRRVLIG
ncbi:MAG: aminotransferase class I/II-fold pyridoxal phosphate-dependent enzyme [Alistipes senegalensis]|nr:aminotransferase class I/II-fold pyridoxal phosphate-dependent enzyme [Alistipes senegalensis]